MVLKELLWRNKKKMVNETEHIVISKKNKDRIIKLGKMGESYNDVIEKLLDAQKNKKW